LNSIPAFEAEDIHNRPDEVGKFIESRKDQILNNALMIYACSVDPMEISFPLAIVPANHGSANDGIIGILDTARQTLATLHIDFQGFSIDGDRKYRLFIEAIIDQLSVGWRPVSSNAGHLGEGVLYRLIAFSKVCLMSRRHIPVVNVQYQSRQEGR